MLNQNKHKIIQPVIVLGLLTYCQQNSPKFKVDSKTYSESNTTQNINYIDAKGRMPHVITDVIGKILPLQNYPRNRLCSLDAVFEF